MVHRDWDEVHDNLKPNSLKRAVSTYLAVFLVEVAIVEIGGVVPGCGAKNKLEIGARRRERDLRVSFPTAILETYLTFFGRPVSVTSVSYLQKKKQKYRC